MTLTPSCEPKIYLTMDGRWQVRPTLTSAPGRSRSTYPWTVAYGHARTEPLRFREAYRARTLKEAIALISMHDATTPTPN